MFNARLKRFVVLGHPWPRGQREISLMNDFFQYPPDLFDLIVQTIPLLNRSKKSVLLFFKGSGVSESLYSDISDQLSSNKDSINKYAITRTILERINEDSDKYLRERRELLKRIIEFEAFSTCWENDILKAKGLVSEIQKVVNVKDSFTRMNQEREKERKKKTDEYLKKINEIKVKEDKIAKLKDDFFKLFGNIEPHKRGKKLESVLNSLFSIYEILIKEDFKRVSENKEGIVEQLDGVVEIDNQIFLVEMKWKKDSIGSDDIYAHLVRIYHRTNAHGFYISASKYTPSAIEAAKEALVKGTLLCFIDLEEIVQLLEKKDNLVQFFKEKIHAAIIEKQPYKGIK